MSPRYPRHGRRGATAVEFALTLPVFLMLVFGLIDFSLYFAGQAMLDSLTGASCESGAELDPLFFNVKEQTQLTIENGLVALPLLTCSGGGCAVGVEFDGVAPAQVLVCQTTVEFQGVTGFTPLPERLNSSSLQRMEWQR
jgi:hypothetical protein